MNSTALTMTSASRLWLTALLALLAFSGQAAAQGTLPPSITVDTAFSPPDGIARDGDAGSDIPGGVAIDKGRIYVAGESENNVAIVARRGNGTYDDGFGLAGRVDIDVGTGKDVASSILVLPDGRLRILGATDADTSSSTNMDIALIGLNADGTPDTTFGGEDGIVTFPIGVIDDTPSRMVAGENGRLAITGWRKDADGKEDTFVAILDSAGVLDPAFDEDGIKTLDRGGDKKNDRGIDIAWRAGGGLLLLQQVATNPDINVNAYAAVLHALDAAGADDPGFSEDGDHVLAVGEPNTIPGALLEHGGRYWVTGSTKVGTDTDSFLFRTGLDGTGEAFRRFDMRGPLAADTALVSGGGDLTVIEGDTPTLVIVGSTTYNSRTYWAAAAFNDFAGELDKAGYGDLIIPTEEYGALLGVVPGDGYLAVAGSLLNVNGNFDTTFGTLRLLIDADKKCDLSLEVPHPLEATLTPGSGTGVTVKVSNRGTRACAGEIAVAPPFSLRGGLVTNLLRPGNAFSTGGTELAYDGPIQREGDAYFTVRAPADADSKNDAARLHVRFSYCDASARVLGSPGYVPTEGRRRFEFDVRSHGTISCRNARVVGPRASSRRTTVAAGRSISDELSDAPAKTGKPGEKTTVPFSVRADGDVQPANDATTFEGTFVGVGDSNIRRANARSVSGRATPGRGPVSARARRVSRVDVAIQRVGGGDCRWLASARTGRFRTIKRSAYKTCDAPVWLRAKGGRAWRLSLARRLPPGRYVAFSRAWIGAGFPEASFTRRDRNRVAFRVR